MKEVRMKANFGNLIYIVVHLLSEMAERFHRLFLQCRQMHMAVLMTMMWCTCLADRGQSFYRSHTASPCDSDTTGRMRFVRDPEDCSVFYTCFGNRYWSRSCPMAGTVYSLRFKRGQILIADIHSFSRDNRHDYGYHIIAIFLCAAANHHG
ncbi:hypothetical protein ACOMHN_060627 [Nucella lapillus]